MKKVFIAIISFAVAAAAVMSCTREINEDSAGQISKTQGVTINVLSGEDATKTFAIDGAVPTIQWTGVDKVRVFEVVDGNVEGHAASENAVLNAGKASFSTTLNWADAGGSAYSYSAVYPASAVEEANSTYSIIMPNNQHLSDNNFADNSDILFSTPLDHGAVRASDSENVQFAFRRLGTVVRLTLNGITANEKIRRVTLTAPVNIAGSITYNPVTGTVDPATAFVKYAYKTIDLVLDDLVATGNDVLWFRVMSASDWAAGSEFDIKVITDGGVYQKNISLPSAIRFPDGGVTKFGVALSSSRLAPVDVPCSWYFDTLATALDGWSLIDNDGDGNNWIVTNNANAVSWVYALRSDSFRDGVSYHPDNWAFTPPIQLTVGNHLSFAVRASGLIGYAEHYAVYIRTYSPLGDGIDLKYETEFPEGIPYETGPDGVYQRYVIEIPDQFDNQVVCIGFRHFNCTAQGSLCIDNVEILESSPNQPCSASYDDYLGQWAVGNKVITIAEYTNGSVYSISGLNGQGGNEVTATFESGKLVLYEDIVGSNGSSEIGLRGSNNGIIPDDYPSLPYPMVFTAAYDDVQDKLIITPGFGFTHYMFLTYDAVNHTKTSVNGSDAIPAELVPYVPSSATPIYQEGFESDVAGTWTFIDADSDGNNWYRLNNLHTASGDYALVSASYINNYGPAEPDNWAFTPPIDLTTDNYLSFWIDATDDTWCAEHYAVYVITETPTSSNLGKCVVLLPEQVYPSGTPVETDANGYQHYVIQIPDTYDGETVHIGFRHFNCTDQYMIALDDVVVYEGNPI